MTYLDRALLDHPQRPAHDIITENCPQDFFYEKESPCTAFCNGFELSFEACGECWRREMPHE